MGFAFCFSTNTVLAYIRKISGNKWVIPRVYYKSCGASTSQSDSYSHKCSIMWIFVQSCPYSSHLQVFQTSPIQRSEGASGTATAPPQDDFGRSVALPGATAWLIPGYLCLEQAGEEMGFGGDGRGLVLHR